MISLFDARWSSCQPLRVHRKFIIKNSLHSRESWITCTPKVRLRRVYFANFTCDRRLIWSKWLGHEKLLLLLLLQFDNEMGRRLHQREISLVTHRVTREAFHNFYFSSRFWWAFRAQLCSWLSTMIFGNISCLLTHNFYTLNSLSHSTVRLYPINAIHNKKNSNHC